MKTLKQLLPDYFSGEQMNRGGRPVCSCARNKLKRFVNWLEDVPQVRFARELTPDAVHRWLSHESSRTNGQTGLPLSPRSFQTTFFKVLPFCHWLARHGHVSHAVPGAFPKLRRIPIQIKPALPHREMCRLLEQIDGKSATGYRNRALGELLYTSGVRIAEALAMNLEDVDLDNAVVRIHGKGNKDRTVPLGVSACHHLRIYLQSIRPLMLRSTGERAVWINRWGGRVRYGRFYREWRRMLGTMGLSIKVTAHTFRRSCATELFRNGAPVWAIRELLGHRKLCTLKFYLDIRTEDLKRTHARCHPRDLPPAADHEI